MLQININIAIVGSWIPQVTVTIMRGSGLLYIMVWIIVVFWINSASNVGRKIVIPYRTKVYQIAEFYLPNILQVNYYYQYFNGFANFILPNRFLNIFTKLFLCQTFVLYGGSRCSLALLHFSYLYCKHY